MSHMSSYVSKESTVTLTEGALEAVAAERFHYRNLSKWHTSQTLSASGEKWYSGLVKDSLDALEAETVCGHNETNVTSLTSAPAVRSDAPKAERPRHLTSTSLLQGYTLMESPRPALLLGSTLGQPPGPS
ncbi:hypothetical protein EYF80_031866 [Liparis tanakae]|uniref:Uncharacterized protein n=1 Tax=Liparis tanakae TaxID=230148 RepID=A0A4Z2GXG5_9TELE|nr:hypothetical protein EYF80_031866 [Liparis tanakae]